MNETKFGNSGPVTPEIPSEPQPAPTKLSAPSPADSNRNAQNSASPRRRPASTYQSRLLSASAPELDRHQRKCSICRRADRDEIEQAFLHWRSAGAIELDYRITERALYRHAHATGLFARRKRNLRFILENVLERNAEARITVDSLLRALRAYVSISDSGEYVERPAHVVVSSGGLFQGAASGIAPTASAPQTATTLVMRVSRRKQPRPKPVSAKTRTTLRKVATRRRARSGSNRQRQSIRNRSNSLKTKDRSRF